MPKLKYISKSNFNRMRRNSIKNANNALGRSGVANRRSRSSPINYLKRHRKKSAKKKSNKRNKHN